MKKLIAILAFLPVLAFAEPITLQRNIMCDKPEEIFKFLLDGEYKEVPSWTSEGPDDTFYIFFLNEKTKTWTFILYNKKIACVLGAGEGYTPIVNPKNKI